ncbi:penicillin acylase family protein [Fodinibius salsisoli]|uniref:Penicillin acylase family protein n=1 Tax=Fodinibius salsisoli TaxID=2820877 RepID=A0ABT3PMP3_9BACT|nr:penicillin acylase family protein [Fodinibius salsisoli]MCW9707053.1 penicillin acylase family protein [Fodinibius salsisoli]
MTKKVAQLLFTVFSTTALFWLLSTSLGPAPPLGSFLSPSSGFWTNAPVNAPPDKSISLSSDVLSDTVQVVFDDQQIPHIFAQNDRDLYFAQGYITARERLWQMEFQTHAAAGRLSEILGNRTVAFDRYQRRIGMTYAAERALEGMMENPETAQAVKAYAAGVNAWITSLDQREYPLEYKILDYGPEQWTPLKTALLLKNMTYTLAGSNQDLRMSNTRALLGDEFIKNVLNVQPALNDPVIPDSKKWGFTPLQTRQPDSTFTPSIAQDIPPFQPNPNNGSNNWAVSGSKTASGYPILANDPHLGMTLPSIWYAMQLHSPEQNVMGVSLPGAPSIIVGFNEDAAWGTTNVSADVWDWYEITFRDSTLSEYRYDGQWKSTLQRVEKIKVKGTKTIIDTVTYTHHGPVVQTSGSESMRTHIPKFHAMRWIAYEKSNELQYFLEINKANDYKEYRQALRHFESPAQNWVFADRSDIALTVAGKYPLKWKYQGRYIGDGSNPKYDWQGWIPFDQIPSVKNPDRGFVSSANQDPTGDAYPYYLDDDFAPYERGRRINERLASMDDITVKDMQRLQMDSFNYHAKTVLPKLLETLLTDTLSPDKQQAITGLANWNYYNKGNQIAPSVFDYWWDTLNNEIWGDEYQSAKVPLQRPARDQTAQLILSDSTLQWYDDINTTHKETLSDLINRSFHQAFQQLEESLGSYGDTWKWGYVNNTNIGHLGRMPGMGQPDVFTDGGAESINAVRGSHGPSWRMVVELGPEVKAYGLYPGGQSGNPGSKYYDNMIDDWAEGKLYPLWFMKQPPAERDSVRYSIVLH